MATKYAIESRLVKGLYLCGNTKHGYSCQLHQATFYNTKEEAADVIGSLGTILRVVAIEFPPNKNSAAN